jgi:glycosyltransferase involved in cell wall biosynthesis
MISILISTIDDKIHKAKNVLLSPRDDIEYIISHQYTSEAYKEIPADLLRNDVTISQIEGKGVARSRNNAIRLASGDVGLFADDDVTYQESYIDLLKKTFQDNPDIDIVLFKIKTRPGEPEYKSYPESPIELKKLEFSASSVEIGFNINKIKESGLKFDERFGAGQELLIISEETIFIEDCLKHGLKVVFIPEYIVEHPYQSTIKSVPKYDKRRNWVTGAYDCRSNGSIALLKAFLGTIKYLPDLLKNGVNPLTYFYHRLSAVIYILRTTKKK